mgnify:FL=1|jgi:glutamate-5-semialdehyde dehydrogenase
MSINLLEMGQKAKTAAFELAHLAASARQEVLEFSAKQLLAQKEALLVANALDVQAYQKENADQRFLDRLLLDEQKINAMAMGLQQIALLPDPLGQMNGWVNHAGLKINQVRVPLGVVGMIYEARPNVTVDAFGLCFKTGNAVILRGGKEALQTNICLSEILRASLVAKGYNPDAIQLICDPSHQLANEFMQLKDLDVLIPRGSARLIQAVVANAKVPVIETGAGNCHLYIDRTFDLEMTKQIVVNAKTQRPSVCNAAEKLLIHQDAKAFVGEILAALRAENVEILGDEAICQLDKNVKLATKKDWETEYNDYTIAVKLVESLDEAIAHINRYSTKHSEAIITNDYQRSQYFLDRVDSACVYVNASTRFTDGFEFGFGAEIGISTQKLHARGPLGLKELTTTKYTILGDGQIRK